MVKKFSFSSLMDIDKIIFIAPILVFASFFHIFSNVPATRSFGQIEVLGAMIIVGYYLWDRIAVIYPHDKIGKKRIEAVACIVGSIFLALLPLAPLMTWQFYNLYNNSDRYSFNKQIIVAIATVWIGIGTMYYSSYVYLANQMAAQNMGVQESSMPTPEAMTQ